MSKKSFYVMAIGMLFPFMHLYLVDGLKLLYIAIIVNLLIRLQDGYTRIRSELLVLSFFLTFSFCLGYLEFGHFEHASKLLFTACFGIFLAMLFPLFYDETSRTKFIRGFVLGFAANSTVNVLIFLQAGGAISRISSWGSIGYSDVGQDLILGQASFNEVGAMTSIAAIFQTIRVLRYASRSTATKLFDLAILLILIVGLLLTGSRSALVALLFCALHIGLLTVKVNKRELFKIIVLISVTVYFAGDIQIGRIMSLISQPDTSDAISAFSRLMAWEDALNVFFQAPAFGVGYGYFPVASQLGLITAESYYFSLLAETGLAGFTSFIVVVYLAIKRNFYSMKIHCPWSDQGRKLENLYGITILVIVSISGTIIFDMVISWFFYTLLADKSSSKAVPANCKSVAVPV